LIRKQTHLNVRTLKALRYLMKSPGLSRCALNPDYGLITVILLRTHD
jgi:hypothetical protein